jgi:BlaI family transcriptional regulator, penicillinase repressor
MLQPTAGSSRVAKNNVMERVNSTRGTGRSAGPRHSILDLAPLELECLSALWPMGEGTVRDIHRQLSVARPRAYTTVLTIMDRLAQKGIVARRKLGRAYWYQANLSADEARSKAIDKIVAGFFDGSAEALASHLSAHLPSHMAPLTATGPSDRSGQARVLPSSVHGIIDAPDTVGGESLPQALDETLL